MSTNMFSIDMTEAAADFIRCWNAAGKHIQNQTGDDQIRWLRAHPYPPFLEHLSFLLGNQFFFIRVEDIDHQVDIPGTREGLLSIANGCAGHACIMPMKKTQDEWLPVAEGWGLLDAQSGQPVYPPALMSNEPIIMTDWELHDLAVQIVREQIEKDGYELMTWQSHPEVNPSIWFVGADGPEWVVVRAARYPEKKARKPDNIAKISGPCNQYGDGSSGNFASVVFISLDESFDANAEENGNIAPLYRGKGIDAKYDGLERLT